MNFIIFIHGKASAGKDTLVKALKYYWFTGQHPGTKIIEEDIQNLINDQSSVFDKAPVKILSFNEGVYLEAKLKNPSIDLNLLRTDYNYKSQFRELLVEIGDGYRQSDPQVWINKHFEILRGYLQEHKQKGQIFVCPSLRYQNEFEYAQVLNTYFDNLLSFTAKVHADLSTRLLRMSELGAQKYLRFARLNDSETNLDSVADKEFDFFVNNNSNIDKNIPDFASRRLQQFEVESKKFLQIRDKFCSY